jgi:arabinan endo-1,5-alpha-L-arabinosidase
MFGLVPLLFTALASAYPNRGPCTGSCWTHDPGMIQRVSDGKYYRFSTGTGVPISSSPSVKGPWTDLGAALPDGTSIKLENTDSTNIWVSESTMTERQS